MRKKSKLIYGIGVNDYKGSVRVNGKDIKAYKVWRHMLQRCYDPKYQEQYPTYKGCKVVDEWHSFNNFNKWFDENYRFDLEDIGIELSLDKDLLGGESKIYSPNTCVFLPKRINSFLANKYSNNTSGFTGVCWYKNTNKWHSRINDFNTDKKKHLGYFTDIQDASKAYIKARKIEAEKVKNYMRGLGYSEEIIDRVI